MSGNLRLAHLIRALRNELRVVVGNAGDDPVFGFTELDIEVEGVVTGHNAKSYSLSIGGVELGAISDQNESRRVKVAMRLRILRPEERDELRTRILASWNKDKAFEEDGFGSGGASQPDEAPIVRRKYRTRTK